MRPRRVAVALCVLLAAVATLAGCSSEAPETVQLGGGSASAPSAGTVERPWGTVTTFPELEKAQIPERPDMTFAAEMVLHHDQAVELSRNVLAHDGIDERVAAAARFIAQDQRNEITTMTAWIDAWVASLPELAQGHHVHDAASMPGMVPEARVDALRGLPTAEAQMSFLALMIAHHEGAVAMSKGYLGNDHNSFTKSIAQHIIREQTVEIDYLRRLADGL
ncbi:MULTISPECIES: DUF305 domain-containing protein [Mumia]|uniref:DUF305 domain-containing protein n=1 Tax=Mumia TaxID=1546255 RepID=UPI00141F3C8C|nr:MULTISPECIES: DUF305 domain-containing protein [unclassified Mumia]QMW68089.1 DUF305 domain-containing protein [Mumia sp. ZJ1417]